MPERSSSPMIAPVATTPILHTQTLGAVVLERRCA